MKIIKSINNNIVSCIDDAGSEVIAMGRGLGYGTRAGQVLEETRVEKIFRMNTPTQTERMKELFASLPEEQIELCTHIIAYAKETLNKKLNQNVYLTLTDHIGFAIRRLQEGMEFHNALYTEVKIFYPQEFAVGKYALSLVRKELHVTLPEDEAASIALHLVNAQFDTSISETLRVTQVLHDVMGILDGCKQLALDPASPYYDEFIIHLKFLALRVFSAEPETRPEENFVTLIRKTYPVEYACADKIIAYLETQSHHPVSDEKRAYLAVHICRVNQKNEGEKNE